MPEETHQNPNKHVSLAFVADVLGVSERRVMQMVTAGIIPKPESRGLYALQPCVRGYIAFIKSDRDDDDEAAEGGGDYKKEKTRLTKAKADLAEMEAKEKKGLLVPSDLVEKTWRDVLTTLKSHFLALPTRIAPLVYEQETVDATKKVIKEAVTRLLQEASQGAVVVDGGDIEP